MKRVLIMVTLLLFPRLLVAQDFDVKSLVGEHWYGLYLKGQKAGFAVHGLSVDDSGVVTLTEDNRFRITMQGARQDMHFYGKRVYAPDGSVRIIETAVEDVSGKSEFNAVVSGDNLVLHTVIGGASSDKEFPRPKESLRDALSQVPLARQDAKLGDELAFNVFDPMMQRELRGVSRIIGIEERVFDGAPTKVFKIKTLLKDLAVETVSYVAQDGTVLEDVTSNFITMRLEPKEVAQDVNYTNDVIVSNAALLDKPLANPRDRASLALLLKGPLTAAHLFNDERQFMGEKDSGFEFRGTKISLKGFSAAQIPIDNAEIKKWVEPSPFVQSDAAEIVAKAGEIVGDEKDSAAISNKLCAWVYDHVRTTYSAQLTNALDVLNHMEGDCTEHSVLFIALARAAGLPAREVAGLVYVNGSPAGFYFHQWAKVWVGKWIDVDPTFNQPLADVTHIKLAEGDLYEQAKLIPVIGQIQVQVLDDAVQAPAEKAPAAAGASPSGG